MGKTELMTIFVVVRAQMKTSVKPVEKTGNMTVSVKDLFGIISSTPILKYPKGASVAICFYI